MLLYYYNEINFKKYMHNLFILFKLLLLFLFYLGLKKVTFIILFNNKKII